MERNGKFLLSPEGCYYALGDNAENSLDFRYWEEPFVKEKEILAKNFKPLFLCCLLTKRKK